MIHSKTSHHRAAVKTASTSNMPRPQSSPDFQGKNSGTPVSVQLALSKGDEAGVDDEENEEFELLEYEWPDLPPLPSMKDAVSRRRVSQGISYLLPVDKGRNSINNRFRTDLRAMFQEPYASDELEYDDNLVKLSAKVHFLSNTADTKWTHQLLSSIPTQLSADCEGARKLYVHSAPSGRVDTRQIGFDPSKLKKRSNLFLPVKARKTQVSPEIVKLQEEAAEIIKQGLTFTDDEEINRNQVRDTRSTTLAPISFHPIVQPNKSSLSTVQTFSSDCMLMTFGGTHLSNNTGRKTLNTNPKIAYTHQEILTNYKDLKQSVPSRPEMPSELQSTFLSPEDNQRVWEWLHYGESMSEFDYFLSICG